LSQRIPVALALAALALAASLTRAAAAPAPRTDLLTLSDAPQPPVGFTSLPYANPNAPKGGSFTESVTADFDNLNPFIVRGTAPDTIFNVWQPLFATSDAEDVTAYADLARSVDIAGNTVTFHLDPLAVFSDGVPVTAADVVWTFNTLITQGSPFYAGYYADVTKAAAPDPHTVVFTLKPGFGRDTPLNLASMYVLPEHFWKGRNFADPLRAFPVGSGPYRVSAVSWGNSVTYQHVPHWWAQDLPANKGVYNFNTVTEDFFQSGAVSLQAFKAGQIDARTETSSKIWYSDYDFPAVRDGQVRLESVPLTLPSGMYGLVFNTRRPVFGNPLVRQALTLAFDFQWMNRVLFHGAYTRTTSYFSNSPMASSGLPSPDELQLLDPFRGQIPNAVFTTPFSLPVTDGSGYNLPQLEAAMKLLNQAGWHVRNFRLVNAAGQQMHFDILLDDENFERIVLPYIADLKLLGIAATVHTADVATYERRMNDFDFDMTDAIFPETDFPGGEQDGYWGCDSANATGSNNTAGVCSPAIDAMIKAENTAQTTAAKRTAIHALDRLLLNGWYVVPFWTSRTEWLAYWQTRVAKPAAPLQLGHDYALWWHK
jgi:microcin C transport system substrate-binding protein